MPLLLTWLFLFSNPSSAFDVPPSRDAVVDEAGLMSSSAREDLARALRQIWSSGGPQVAVLTVDRLDDTPIEDASMEVVKKWKLGSESKDNGVLLMISKRDRRMRIEVGQGLEGSLTDVQSGRIIDRRMVPLFRRGQFEAGILVGVSEILKHMEPPISLEDHYQGEIHHSPPSRLNWIHLLLLIGLLIFLSGGGSGFIGVPLGLGYGWGSSRGGRSYGGGGWSGGGGGGFSGGGASGSW